MTAATAPALATAKGCFRYGYSAVCVNFLPIKRTFRPSRRKRRARHDPAVRSDIQQARYAIQDLASLWLAIAELATDWGEGTALKLQAAVLSARRGAGSISYLAI